MVQTAETFLKGVVLLHKIADFAIFAVLAMAISTIPSALFSPSLDSCCCAEAFVLFPTIQSVLPKGNHHHHRFRQKAIPRLDPTDLQTLESRGYVVVEDFLQETKGLREDVLSLRDQGKFKVARIGQDSTNALNQEIRVAETCFLGREKEDLQQRIPNPSREHLYDVLEGISKDLETILPGGGRLDEGLSEFLYAYYPKGGFYRRHKDAIKGSPSWLREYSLLLYLNDESYDADQDGGQLRIHFDSGGDFLPEGEAPLFQDVDAKGGTLVLFESNKLPHEVLDTNKERFAVVGWYNRPMSLSEISNIQESSQQLGGSIPLVAAFAVAAALVTVGLINVIS